MGVSTTLEFCLHVGFGSTLAVKKKRHVHHPTSLTRSTCLLGLHRVTGSIVFSRDYSNDSNGLGCPTRDFRLDDKEMNAL